MPYLFGDGFIRRHSREEASMDNFVRNFAEGHGWGLEVSAYIHINPVVMSSLGFGKKDRAAERQGLKKPNVEEVKRRLDRLRSFCEK